MRVKHPSTKDAVRLATLLIIKPETILLLMKSLDKSGSTSTVNKVLIN